jgi:hypothetical protein
MEFANAFVKEIGPEKWLYLQQFLISLKTNIHKQTNLKELEVEFDHDTIENHAMISWYEVFPYSEQIIKDNNNTQYLLDDQYCLRSDCNCTQTALSIIELKNNEIVQKEHTACYFNYNKNTIEPLDGPVTENIIELITKYGYELKKEYKKRHEILRKLYRDYRKRANITKKKTILNPGRPGRNDPCPCGSGKKYKKCCLN